MGHTTHDSTLILQWNCRSINSNLPHLLGLVQQTKPLIISLCETWLCIDDSFKLFPYTVFRKDREGRGGGVAILLHPSLKVTKVHPINTTQKQIDILAINVSGKNLTPFTVISWYSSQIQLTPQQL